MPGLGAAGADHVTGIPSEQIVVLVNLLKVLPPAPDAAAIADSGAPGDSLGGYVVRAVTMMLVADALATIPLRTYGAYANFVELVRLATGGDEPPSGALVASENVLGVELVESEPSKDVGGRSFGSWFLRGLR